MQQLLLESAADIVKDDCFISHHPRHFNTAIGSVAENLDSVVERCQLSSRFSFLRRRYVGSEHVFKKCLKVCFQRL